MSLHNYLDTKNAFYGYLLNNDGYPSLHIGMTLIFPQMGGCPEPAGVCNSTNCFGHEVDLIHFELNQAIPGRLYGGNLADSINGTGRDRYNFLITTRKLAFLFNC